jgi:hypothetical protein
LRNPRQQEYKRDTLTMKPHTGEQRCAINDPSSLSERK